jgi:hypothetical protein
MRSESIRAMDSASFVVAMDRPDGQQCFLAAVLPGMNWCLRLRLVDPVSVWLGCSEPVPRRHGLFSIDA